MSSNLIGEIVAGVAVHALDNDGEINWNSVKFLVAALNKEQTSTLRRVFNTAFDSLETAVDCFPATPKVVPKAPSVGTIPKTTPTQPHAGKSQRYPFGKPTFAFSEPSAASPFTAAASFKFSEPSPFTATAKEPAFTFTGN
jgi:hypothetical protein